jgi:hypothetical protein
MRQADSFEEHIRQVELYLDGAFDRYPRDILKKKGVVVRPLRRMSDAEVSHALQELLGEFAQMKLYFDHTDHLSDRQLYETILKDVLTRSFEIGGEEWSVFDCAEVYDEESRQIYLAYYADDQTRIDWADMDEFELPVPERRPKPYDRDSHLPRPDDWDGSY